MVAISYDFEMWYIHGPFVLLYKKTMKQSVSLLWTETRGRKRKRLRGRIMETRKQDNRRVNAPPHERIRHMKSVRVRLKETDGAYRWSRRRRRWRSRPPAPLWSGNPGTSPASSSSGIHLRSLLTKDPATAAADMLCKHAQESLAN